jgi:hypothetical protein
VSVNLNVTPNSVHYQGDTHFDAHFGAVYDVRAICLPGRGHRPHVDIRFTGGLRVALSPEAMAEVCRRGQEELEKLPFIPEIHDAIGIGDE